MKRAILTGFEPFGPYKFNPVQDTTKEVYEPTYRIFKAAVDLMKGGGK